MRHHFDRAAASYDEAAVLAREVGQRMAARLDFMKLSPARIADIGCATGDGIRTLQDRYPQSLPLAIDYAPAMLAEVARRASWLDRVRRRAPRCIAADVRALPLRGGTLSLAWSNLMLHWLDDPLPSFRELNRVLEVGGLLMFSALGPDTLKELRAAGATTLRRFHDMHDLGDMLVGAGFAEPVMDMEHITLTFASPERLLAELRELGRNLHRERFGALRGRNWRAGLVRAIEGTLGAGDGEPAYALTFEIIYGHALKPQARMAVAPETSVSLQRMRDALRESRGGGGPSNPG